MSDPRRSSGTGWSIATAVACLVLLSVVLPAGFAFFGAVRSASFFGVQPSEAERAQSAAWLWAGFVVSAASLVAIIALAVVNRRRGGVAAFVVISLLAVGVAGVWLIVALGTQRASDAEASSAVRAGYPSPAPTVVASRHIPEVRGTNGNVTVGLFARHRTCVLGEVRTGGPTWSVAGASIDGGCLATQHG